MTRRPKESRSRFPRRAILAGTWVPAACVILFAACSPPPPPPSAPPAPEAPAEAPATTDDAPPPAPDPAPHPAPSADPQTEPAEDVVDPGPAAPFTPTPARGPLQLKLSLSPGDDLSVAEAESFYLAIHIKNPTNRLLHPDLLSSELLVNGKRLKYWSETVADLPKSGAWVDLPPGRSVDFIFKVAEKVRVKPGDYVFVLRTGSSVSQSVRLHVRP